MKEATKSGFMTATDLADYLVLKDVPFREAHGIVGRIVGFCIKRGCELAELDLAEMQNFAPVIAEDVYEVLSVDGSVQSRISNGGTSQQRVEEALRAAENQMGIAR
jgi:argininosuccinate lyase